MFWCKVFGSQFFTRARTQICDRNTGRQMNSNSFDKTGRVSPHRGVVRLWFQTYFRISVGQFGALLQMLRIMGEKQQLAPLIGDTLPCVVIKIIVCIHCVLLVKLRLVFRGENLVSLWLLVLLLGRRDVQKIYRSLCSQLDIHTVWRYLCPISRLKNIFVNISAV